MKKEFVDVIVQYTKEGQRLPLTIVWTDGIKYNIDKVTDIRQAPSLKAGGQGIRYTCKIKGQQTYLWLEDGKWFVEAK